MFKIHELRELIKLVDQSSIEEFDMEHEGSKITMKKQGEVVTTNVAPQPVQVQAAPAMAPVQAEVEAKPEPVAAPQQATATEAAKPVERDENLLEIKSPMVGTFYRKPSPDAEAFVKVGDKVEDASIVCLVEAMKLFNEIEAEVKGEIVEVLVEDAQLVEYGQTLFLVRPE